MPRPGLHASARFPILPSLEFTLQVYLSERIKTHDRAWHTSCFRCTTCNKQLAMHNAELDETHQAKRREFSNSIISSAPRYICVPTLPLCSDATPCRRCMHLSPRAQTYCKVHFIQRWKARGDGGAKHLGQAINGDSGGISDSSDGGTKHSACSSAEATASSTLASSTTASTPAGNSLEATKATVVRRFSAAVAAEGIDPRAALAPNRVLPSWATDNQARCVRCSKNVYAMEKRTARSHDGDQQVYHDKCFRCAECNTLLRNNNFELLDGVTLLCKAHFLARVHAGKAGTEQAES